MDNELRRLEREVSLYPADVSARTALDSARRRVGLPTTRDLLDAALCAAMHRLRIDGPPIMSGIDGFYILDRPYSNDKFSAYDDVRNRLKNQTITIPPDMLGELRELSRRWSLR